MISVCLNCAGAGEYICVCWSTSYWDVVIYNIMFSSNFLPTFGPGYFLPTFSSNLRYISWCLLPIMFLKTFLEDFFQSQNLVVDTLAGRSKIYSFSKIFQCQWICDWQSNRNYCLQWWYPRPVLSNQNSSIFRYEIIWPVFSGLR